MIMASESFIPNHKWSKNIEFGISELYIYLVCVVLCLTGAILCIVSVNKVDWVCVRICGCCNDNYSYSHDHEISPAGTCPGRKHCGGSIG